MLFHTYGQSQMFITMLLAGLVIGAMLDALNLTSRVLEAGRVLQGALDLVFALLLAITLILSMYLTNFGEMRVFCVLGAASGLCLYYLTLRPALRLVIGRPFGFALNCVRRLIGTPIMKKILR